MKERVGLCSFIHIPMMPYKRDTIDLPPLDIGSNPGKNQLSEFSKVDYLDKNLTNIDC